MGDVKLLIGVGLMTGLFRAFTGPVSRPPRGRARPRRAARAAADRPADVRPVRAVPDLRRALGDLRPRLRSGAALRAAPERARAGVADRMRCRCTGLGPSSGCAGMQRAPAVRLDSPRYDARKPVVVLEGALFGADRSAGVAATRASARRTQRATNGVCSHDDDAPVMRPSAHTAPDPSGGPGPPDPRPSAPATPSRGSVRCLLVPLLVLVGVGSSAAPASRSAPTSCPTPAPARPRSPSSSPIRRPRSPRSTPSRRISASRSPRPSASSAASTPTSRRSESDQLDGRQDRGSSGADYLAQVAQLQLLDTQLDRITSRRCDKRSQLARAQGAPRRPPPVRPTTPTGPRCSRRSCRAARSPTSCPRSATRSTSASRTRRSPSRSSAGPGDARRRSTRPSTTTRTATDDLRVETAAQKVKLDQQLKELKAAQAELKQLEAADGPGARDPEGRLREARREQAQPRQGDRRRRPRREGRSRPQISDLVAEAVRPRQHPVAVQRHAALADGRHGHPGLRLHRLPVGAAARLCAHFHQGIDIVAPRLRRPGQGRPATAGRLLSAGTTPTAPTRPGS